MKRLLMVILAACGILWVGCHQETAKHYAVSGEVISVDVPTERIMLKHGDIPGFMPAMTMDYKVADAKQMAELKPGDVISADLSRGNRRRRGRTRRRRRSPPASGTRTPPRAWSPACL